MEIQLEQADALNGFRFDVLDAVNIEKMVLVIGNEKALYLARIHPAVGLRHVNDR
jgi:hypothetical protein